MTLFNALDILGTAVFAVTGALVAIRVRMDFFGIVTVATITANGGGTIRDIIIHNYPIFWVTNPLFLIIAAVFGALTCLVIFYLKYFSRFLLLLDALGLATFTILGTGKCLALGLDPLIAVLMGVMTGVAGGVIRDIFCGTVPLILREEVYATAAILGAAAYLILHYYTTEVLAELVGLGVIFVIRVIAIYTRFSLPTFDLHQYLDEQPRDKL